MSRRAKQTGSPHVQVFGPTNLQREQSTDRQKRFDEETIKWGDDDALPMRILTAVDQSPTTIACLDEVRKFIQGSEFTDKGLMNLVIDADGTTLWDFHCQLTEYLSLLDGFSVNFKYNMERQITSAYVMGVESCRFKAPEKGSKDIHYIKYNPYFGTNEYDQKFTKEYCVFDLNKVPEQLQMQGTQYRGQIYFYGAERPRYKFYPVPKYWSGKEWIYVDGQIQMFHRENLDNGFFQSVMLKLIGDPNKPSKNPKYQKYKTGTNGEQVPDGSSKTVGEEFDDHMSTNFSGVKKAGTVMALWSLNKEDSPQIEAFPNNTQFDVLSGTFTDSIRGITIATQVPAILANLPQQASSLGSDGNSIRAAIDLMQTRVSARQRILENFYNQVLLKNFHQPTSAQVKIKNYIPISTEVSIDDKYWEFMDDQEKADFINNNVPNIKVKPRLPAPAPSPTPGIIPGQEQATADQPKVFNIQQVERMGKMKYKYQAGQWSLEQALIGLRQFGFTDDEIKAYLQSNGEEVTV